MNILSLPSDILTYQLTFLSINDLRNFCQIHSKISKLVNNYYLWQVKCQMVHNDLINMKQRDETWKSFYFAALKAQLISVYYNSRYYEAKLIVFRLTVKQLTNYILIKLNLEPLNISLTFATSNWDKLAYSTFDKNGHYYEKSCDYPNWNSQINIIKVQKGSIGKLMVDRNLASFELTLHMFYLGVNQDI